MSDSLSKEAKAALAGIGLTAAGATLAAGKIASTKKRGLRRPKAKTEAKVAQRIKADLDKGTRIVDDAGNLRSETTVNNANKRFRRMGNRLISIQNKVDAKNLAKDRIKTNSKKLAKLTSKLIYRKITASHPVAAVAAQALMPSKLGDATIHKGFKQKAFKRK